MLRAGLLVDVEHVPEAALLLDTRLALTGPPGRDRFDSGHLPGARYVDLDDDLAAPPGRGGRHPLPEPDVFVAAMQGVGLTDSSQVVAYDDGPGTAAARLWWLLRDHGFDAVTVLDGGLAAWRRAGRPVATGPDGSDAAPGTWRGHGPGHLAAVSAEAASRVADTGVLLDVRAPERFRGEHEPIDPVAGHVPGAVNAPLAENTDEDGRFRSPDELRRRFEALGVHDDVPVAAYCGSGVTATQTLLALRLAGFAEAALYAGSWSEWITDSRRPVSTGESR